MDESKRGRVSDDEDDNANDTTPKRRVFALGVPGLELIPDFVSPDEETALLQHIDASAWDTSLSRRTQHYGHRYDYSNKAATQVAPSLPEWCTFVMDRLVEQGHIAQRPDQLIVNEYTPGQGIYPHVDHTGYFADGIVSISLGAQVNMDFINGAKKEELPLPKRSALVLHGEARYKWRHGIAARKTDHGRWRDRRVSMTFRKMK